MEQQTPRKEKVLVVDDDPALCELVSQVLRLEGYEPILCLHPDAALAAATEESFGLVFIDINLPEKSGLDLGSEIKALLPLCEVVFITGFGTFDNAVQAIKVGAYDYLRKPFTIDELRLCLKRYQQRTMLLEKARLAEQRYSSLVQSIPLVIYVIRRDFQVDFINQACQSVLGYTPEEAMSSPNWFLERIHPEERDRVGALLQSAFQTGDEAVLAECRLLHRSGCIITAIIKSIPSRWQDAVESQQHMEGYIVDISERVFLEKALVQKEKLKTLGAISAEVAHEIRNPLVALAGFAQRLMRRFPEAPECRIILQEAERLEKLLDRIRSYLRPVDMIHRGCSINEIIHESVDLFRPEMERRMIGCDLNLNPDLPMVEGDPDVLKQVFINLLRNAMEAVPDGSPVSIKTSEGENHVHIDFKNPVVKPLVKDLEGMFVPFGEGGQSFGLPLCYRFIKNMGGILSFSQDGRCLVFNVSLPKTPQHSRFFGPASGVTGDETSLEKLVERRREPRIKVDWPSVILTANRLQAGVLKNFSPSGAFIACRFPPQAGETLRIIISPTDQREFSATGQVVWQIVDAVAHSEGGGVAIRFVALTPQDQEGLLQLMELSQSNLLT
jgi:two-component system, NtrC family, sensor histidine kinase HydH